MSTLQNLNWRDRLHKILFRSDTKTGKVFDIILVFVIILSIIVVMLDSVPSLSDSFHEFLYYVEWVLTILFTLEYILRIITSQKPIRYITSFYGIIDLLAILPTYLSIFLVGTQYLIIIRSLRLLRIFRIFKLGRFVGASRVLLTSLTNSRHKIGVFLGAVMIIVIIMGSLMYLIEGPNNGFRSIPTSIYWAIVTLTTVGYGDIAPQTVLGQTLASFVMILGYAIIAVPTGIISVEISRASTGPRKLSKCENCGDTEHDDNAKYCKSCGNKL